MGIKSFLKHIDRYFEEYICVILLVLLVSLLGVSVFSRYVLSRAWAWQEELTRIVFVLFIYFGFSLAAMKRAHIRIISFVRLFPEIWRDKIILIADIVWVVFNLSVIIISIELLTTMHNFPYYSAAMNINMFYIYLFIPLIFALANYRIIQYYYRKFKPKIINKEGNTEK